MAEVPAEWQTWLDYSDKPVGLRQNKVQRNVTPRTKQHHGKRRRRRTLQQQSFNQEHKKVVGNAGRSHTGSSRQEGKLKIDTSAPRHSSDYPGSFRMEQNGVVKGKSKGRRWSASPRALATALQRRDSSSSSKEKSRNKHGNDTPTSTNSPTRKPRWSLQHIKVPGFLHGATSMHSPTSDHGKVSKQPAPAGNGSSKWRNSLSRISSWTIQGARSEFTVTPSPRPEVLTARSRNTHHSGK